ncbi:MAG: ATP-dependent DNA helicase [Patescibacteria group bacterium]
MKMDFDEAYTKLNKAQKQAVDAVEGPLLVVAGPGSGKTQILSLRVANILRQTQVLPSNILCLTFTESAALNMRDRLVKLMGQEAYRVAIHTFHNFCVNIIQKYPEFFYGGALFAAADPLGQIAILEEIFDSLPHSNPLRSVHPEQGYVYLRSVSSSIANIKKAGLAPSEFKSVLAENQKELGDINEILAPLFNARMSKKSFDEVANAISKLDKISRGAPKQVNVPALSGVIARSLEMTLERACEADETKPLSAWKEKMMKKDDEGNRVFKDALNIEKMIALADVYERYFEIMHLRGLYDFDDMILDTIAAIEKNPRLRYELQEQYQYMLVDEFQDTNDAQMRLLRLIADAPVNEGRPNLMVVGDDDQAVYKFQGAELSNILDFKRIYTDVSLVTMTANYRSTQDILDVASHIIRKGENRLENLLPEMEKTLVSSHPDLAKKEKGSQGITHRRFKSSLHEYHFVSREIKRLIDSGRKPEEIAVIARKHHQLESIVPFMQGAGVPIRYEREQNVFLEPHIHQLVMIARFIVSLADASREEADQFLPEILSYPFWKLSRETIWKISTVASRGKMEKEGTDEIGKWQRVTWIYVMIESEDAKVRAVGKFLLELGVKAAHEPLEKMLDMMIGAHVILAAESEDEEDIEDIGKIFKAADEGTYVSPFKEYYFSKERFDHARAEYLTFLSSLRVFVRALREYKGKNNKSELLLLRDLVHFVDLHEKNDIPLNDKSPFGSINSSVYLLSAHKAKGLEFETVFVLSCQDDVWAGRGLGKKISFPLNLPIDPAGDDQDDQLRLFYVALTRAKRYLYLTSYEVRDDGEPSSLLRFLLPGEQEDSKALEKEALRDIYSSLEGVENIDVDGTPEAHELLTASWLRYHTPPFLGEERRLLESLLENYQLSVTHLNNFLNVKGKGPQTFLEQNLLRFPQSRTPSGSYGSAIHSSLEQLSVSLRREGKLPEEEQLIAWFDEYLRRERLSKTDHTMYEKRGREALAAFYKVKKDTFLATDKTEVNFKDQGVVLDHDTQLTGKIDRVVETGGNKFEVHDYKTGKAKDSWDGRDQNEKIKLYEYERQLVFYKLLVEGSRDFGGKYSVVNGVLEFIEPMGGRVVDLSLHITKEQAERLAKLACAVHGKIMKLDFPDISKYSPDLEGIRAFEEDLLLGL